MHRIEWSTLLFFAAMFIQLECLERLRLITWFSQQTISLITLSDDPDVQLTFAIIILMWVSQSTMAYFPVKISDIFVFVTFSTLILDNFFCRSFRVYYLASSIQFQ